MVPPAANGSSDERAVGIDSRAPSGARALAGTLEPADHRRGGPAVVRHPKSKWVEVVVGFGSWLVFVVDLVVQHRMVPGYLHTSRGRFDLAIVVLTFPFYLIAGVAGGSAIRSLPVSRASFGSCSRRPGCDGSQRALGRSRRSPRRCCCSDRSRPTRPSIRRTRSSRRSGTPLVGDRHADEGRLRGHRPEHAGRPLRRNRHHVHRHRDPQRALGLARGALHLDEPSTDTESRDVVRLALPDALSIDAELVPVWPNCRPWSCASATLPRRRALVAALRLAPKT